MRRLTAYFALSVVWAGILNPFVTAAQLSTVPACCRRSGVHHCQTSSGSSRETGFRAASPKCPFATPLLSAALTGLESTRFSLSSPAIAELVVSVPVDPAYAATARSQSARAPPPSFL